MKFVVGVNGRNPEKNQPRLRFVHHETQGVTEVRTRDPSLAVGSERVTACSTESSQYMYFIVVI